MELDVAATAAAVMPYATAVVAAYGKDTIDKVRDAFIDRSSDATVALGHQLLNRIICRQQSREPIENALLDLANDEEDSEAAFRLQVRKALLANPELAGEIAQLLQGATRIEASGIKSIAFGSSSGIVNTGSNTMNIGAQNNYGPGTFIGRDYYGSADDTI